ncbi:hypothetical protein SKAU_G00376720 [Synaphobranchus kaupii]|uniref:Uncharacterized protein n=1 Tax=Synaphobranchus kaupii TaxID=118154 RepID=A0A9Q1IE86_SYNKA|nr:hypothetical protein SKAU_G00376720 [Synaphobranchus kaupii]
MEHAGVGCGHCDWTKKGKRVTNLLSVNRTAEFDWASAAMQSSFCQQYKPAIVPIHRRISGTVTSPTEPLGSRQPPWCGHSAKLHRRSILRLTHFRAQQLLAVG